MWRSILCLVVLLLALSCVSATVNQQARARREEHKEELLRAATADYKNARDTLNEARADLRDSLREKGEAFKSGAAEGAWEAKKGEPIEGMPTVDEKLNEAAHDAGFIAGATKEKVKENLEALREGAREKATAASEALREKAAYVGGKVKQGAEAMKEGAKETAREIHDSAAHASEEALLRAEKLREGAKEAASKVEEGGHSLFDKLKHVAGKVTDKMHHTGDKVRAELKGMEAHTKDKLAEEHLHEAARQKILAEHARLEYETLKARLDLGPPTPTLLEELHRAKEKLTEKLHEAKEAAEKIGDKAKETLHKAEHRVEENIEYVKDTLGEGLHRASDRVSEAKQRAADAKTEAAECGSHVLGTTCTMNLIEEKETREELEAAKEHHRHITHAHTDEFEEHERKRQAEESRNADALPGGGARLSRAFQRNRGFLARRRYP